jgi:hypothetical protein
MFGSKKLCITFRFILVVHNFWGRRLHVSLENHPSLYFIIFLSRYHPWGRILGRNWDKSLKIFPPSIRSHLHERILLPSLLWQKWLEIGLDTFYTETLNLRLSRLYPETSTKWYLMNLASSLLILYMLYSTYLHNPLFYQIFLAARSLLLGLLFGFSLFPDFL